MKTITKLYFIIKYLSFNYDKYKKKIHNHCNFFRYLKINTLLNTTYKSSCSRFIGYLSYKFTIIYIFWFFIIYIIKKIFYIKANRTDATCTFLSVECVIRIQEYCTVCSQALRPLGFISGIMYFWEFLNAKNKNYTVIYEEIIIYL